MHFEDAYTFRNGYFVTKRGEERPADRDREKTMDIVTLAKCFMAWHCQRPNNFYNENKLFDKYFKTLFRIDYPPSDILALSRWARCVRDMWNDAALPLNEALLATRAYSQFHLLYAIEACFAAASNKQMMVPAPAATQHALVNPNTIVNMTATCFNSAFEAAAQEYAEREKVFSPPNWTNRRSGTTVCGRTTASTRSINSSLLTSMFLRSKF